MIILTLRTDKPEAEIGLYDDQAQLNYEVWQAHRALAETLHKKIEAILQSHKKGLQHIQGIVIFEGPGSFTGLRIGMAAANALAYSLQVPIVACSEDWIESGIRRLLAGETDQLALPQYGSEAFVTLPKK